LHGPALGIAAAAKSIKAVAFGDLAARLPWWSLSRYCMWLLPSFMAVKIAKTPVGAIR